MLLCVAAFAYALDLISKLIVVAKLEYHAPIDLLGDWLQFRATRNGGAAFGMGQGLTIVLTVIAAAVVVVILRLARKLNSLPWAIALGLLLGGAFGNLTDRIFRAPSVFEGHVVDFIAPKHFAIFNLADSAIVVGGCLIVLLSFLGLQPDGTREGDADPDAEAEAGADGDGNADADAKGDSDDSGAASASGAEGESAAPVAAPEPGQPAEPGGPERSAGDVPAGATRAAVTTPDAKPARPAEAAGADHVVESGPDAGHTRIS
ncbi:lipoprotein signal peptidase [Embleya sp. AB8]